MKHTGNIAEMKASAEWAGGVMYEKIDAQPGITKGAGDLLSTGEDINIWLKALSEGKVITEKSFKAMITDYSSGEGYGYGIRCPFFGGIGHHIAALGSILQRIEITQYKVGLDTHRSRQ